MSSEMDPDSGRASPPPDPASDASTSYKPPEQRYVPTRGEFKMSHPIDEEEIPRSSAPDKEKSGGMYTDDNERECKHQLNNRPCKHPEHYHDGPVGQYNPSQKEWKSVQLLGTPGKRSKSSSSSSIEKIKSFFAKEGTPSKSEARTGRKPSLEDAHTFDYMKLTPQKDFIAGMRTPAPKSPSPMHTPIISDINKVETNDEMGDINVQSRQTSYGAEVATPSRSRRYRRSATTSNGKRVGVSDGELNFDFKLGGSPVDEQINDTPNGEKTATDQISVNTGKGDELGLGYHQTVTSPTEAAPDVDDDLFSDSKAQQGLTTSTTHQIPYNTLNEGGSRHQIPRKSLPAGARVLSHGKPVISAQIPASGNDAVPSLPLTSNRTQAHHRRNSSISYTANGSPFKGHHSIGGPRSGQLGQGSIKDQQENALAKGSPKMRPTSAGAIAQRRRYRSSLPSTPENDQEVFGGGSFSSVGFSQQPIALNRHYKSKLVQMGEESSQDDHIPVDSSAQASGSKYTIRSPLVDKAVFENPKLRHKRHQTWDGAPVDFEAEMLRMSKEAKTTSPFNFKDKIRSPFTRTPVEFTSQSEVVVPVISAQEVIEETGDDLRRSLTPAMWDPKQTKSLSMKVSNLENGAQALDGGSPKLSTTARSSMPGGAFDVTDREGQGHWFYQGIPLYGLTTETSHEVERMDSDSLVNKGHLTGDQGTSTGTNLFVAENDHTTGTPNTTSKNNNGETPKEPSSSKQRRSLRKMFSFKRE